MKLVLCAKVSARYRLVGHHELIVSLTAGCAKGTRECNYPEPASATKSTSTSKLGQPPESIQESESSSGEYEDEELDFTPLTAQSSSETPKPPRPQLSGPNVRSTTKKQSGQNNQAYAGPLSTSKLKEKSLSPPADDSSGYSKSRSTSTTFDSTGQMSSISPATSHDHLSWSQLKPEMQHYLHYHRAHLTFHHYFFKHGAAHFVNHTLVETALEYEPLLYALVGFAAFHETTKKPDGKIGVFLDYYNKSVQGLLLSLKRGQKHTDATLLTILQLAAFEEYLGDWVNLISHQKAAYEMILEMYSPNTIMHTETSRKILAWYTRFDIFAGLISVNKTVLSRDWIAASEVYYGAWARKDPTNLDYQMENNIATHRLIAIDMTVLFAKLPTGNISMADFHRENDLIAQRIQGLRQQFAHILSKNEYRVMSFEDSPRRDPYDIVDPYVPGLLFKGPLFTLNYMQINWYAIESMHKYQTAMILQQPAPQDLQRLALEQCRLLEAIEFWHGSPAGAVLPAQASLAMNCLFLPRDEKHISWCRRKLAKIESMGYIYPSAFRTKIAELWNIPDIEIWWFPNEDGYPPIIKSIRAFIEERTREPRDQGSEDVRNIKSMLPKLDIDDSPKESPESTSSMGRGVPAGTYDQANFEPSTQRTADQVSSGMDTELEGLEPPVDLWFVPTAHDGAAEWNVDAGTGYYHPPR
ncbi:hypothetical protein MMC13_007235 [Lambiella insularis]|nr:hypothetical protein [Lambiella insularis]